MKMEVTRKSCFLLAFVELWIFSNFFSKFSLGSNVPAHLGFPPQLNSNQNGIYDDQFNINDTIEKENNFQDSVNSFAQEKKETAINATNFVKSSCNVNNDSEYQLYYEFLLNEVLEMHFKNHSNININFLLNKLEFIFKGFKTRWNYLAKLKVNPFLKDVNKILKNYLNYIQVQHSNLSYTFPFLYICTVLTIFSLAIYLMLKSSQKPINTLQSSPNQEMIIHMLQRINWFCEKSSSQDKFTKNEFRTTLNEVLGQEMQVLHNSLNEIDTQLEDLGKFAHILSNIVHNIQQDIQSIQNTNGSSIQNEINPNGMYTYLTEPQDIQDVNQYYI